MSDLEKKISELELRVLELEKEFMDKKAGSKRYKKAGAPWHIIDVIYNNPGIPAEQMASEYIKRVGDTPQKITLYQPTLSRLAKEGLVYEKEKRWYPSPKHDKVLRKRLGIT